jgi:hypothetical protein
MKGKYEAKFKVQKEKDITVPVWPTEKGGEELLGGFLEFAQRNRDNKRLQQILGLGLEAPRLDKLAAIIKRMADCGTDLQEMARLYDEIQDTESEVMGDFVVSIPGIEHNGVGFYPIQLADELEWLDTETDEWKTGFLASPSANDDGEYNVSDEDDPMSDSRWVERRFVRRPRKK